MLFVRQAQNKVLKQRLITRLNNETPQLQLPPNSVPDSELDQNVLKNLRSAIADLNKLADEIEFVIHFVITFRPCE